MFKNLKICFLFIFFVALFLGRNVYADTSINLEIVSGGKYLYAGNINVSPCDSDKNANTPDVATPYCAILQSGLSSIWNWDWAPGAYVESINGVKGYTSKDSLNNDVYHYWSWYLNGEYGEMGLNQYELQNDDNIKIEFIDPGNEKKVVGGKVLVVDKYSLENAIKFLLSKQNKDGSFGSPIYTDWVAIGVAKTNEKKSEKIINSLKDYLKNNKFIGKNITDYERHAMALMSLGIDPYKGTSVDYISAIVNSFDGKQIGDKNLINDDIFGLIVLQKSGFTEDDEIIKQIISNIIKNQSKDGSWGSVDMTSASIMALYNFKDINGVKDSIYNGYKFIKSNQENGGSYGNAFSTSWAMQAFSLEDWYQDEIDRSLKYLAREQKNEYGYIEQNTEDSKIWATAYSIPAYLKLSWTDILQDFPKQEIKKISKTLLVKNKNNQEEIIENQNLNTIPEISNNKYFNNIFKDKVIIMTILLTLFTIVGGLFVIKR